MTSWSNRAGDKSIALPADVVRLHWRQQARQSRINNGGLGSLRPTGPMEWFLLSLCRIPEVAGFVKLDDEGTWQSITGGGGLDGGRHLQ